MALFKKIKNEEIFDKNKVISSIEAMVAESYPEWRIIKIDGCDFCLLRKIQVQQEIRINQYKDIVPRFYLDNIVVDVLASDEPVPEKIPDWAIKYVIVDSHKALARVLKEHK